ncbi:uncharacterized protein N7483_006149 [Penicillium malachiteum]|uniref:uncharacterized protein n=1 Tax=Penicillium malachiteum TaxID=1324776 RepID=UPI0025485929|nr:uncharacterized protein N7483_006149 [Penicillium malachiteum]KAJ5731641.1 hypothetical protein N7483_006149 [Penicillium malachiteum]
MVRSPIKINLPFRINPSLSVWTELKVPKDAEHDEKQWKGNFMPLLKAPGHVTSMWARVIERPDKMILATLWKNASAYRDFLASPSAQLFTEGLTAHGITMGATHKSIDGPSNMFSQLKESKVQLFWFRFPPNLHPRATQARSRFAIKLWPRPAAVPRVGEGVTMIWVHFWQQWTEIDKEKALVSFLEGDKMIESKHWWEVPEMGGVVEANAWEVSCCSFKEL